MDLGMVVSGILDIRGHTHVEGYSEYHHAFMPSDRNNKPPRITQACTPKRVHNEPLKIPNNNLDVRFEQAHQNHKEIVQTRK